MEAVPAIVLTPVLGVAWLAGPFVLAWLALSHGNYVLAALFVPIALVWSVALVKDPTPLGLLLAWPAGVWSVLQQRRGKVHTEDLEDGRYVSLAEARRPAPAERAVLDMLARDASIPELDRQLDQARVIAECVCGCASIRLLSSAPALVSDDRVLAATGVDSRGRRVDVRLRVALGTVHDLEVTGAGGHDGSADELPA